MNSNRWFETPGKFCVVSSLPYRVVELCTGDLGFASAKTYDLEVWAAGTDYLSRDQVLVELRKFPSAPGQLRYRKDKKGRPLFVHTLNGSGLSFGRTLVAVLENYQQKDGSVVIPEALRPYMSGLDQIR